MRRRWIWKTKSEVSTGHCRSFGYCCINLYAAYRLCGLTWPNLFATKTYPCIIDSVILVRAVKMSCCERTNCQIHGRAPTSDDRIMEDCWRRKKFHRNRLSVPCRLLLCRMQCTLAWRRRRPKRQHPAPAISSHLSPACVG